MQVTDSLKLQFGNWIELFRPFIESEEFGKIFGFLKAQVQAKKIVLPKAPELFKSFELVDKDKLRAIIWLMDPYPTVKDDIVLANGIPMNCSNTGYLQPSLQLFYSQIESAYLAFDPGMDYNVDNSYLLTEEHIMLINSSLSLEKDKVGSHYSIWEPFMKYFIEEVLNKFYRGLPIVLCGTQAQRLEKYINPLIHHIKKIEHPVAGSYSNREWHSDGVFKWIDNIILQNNGMYEVPKWYRKIGPQDRSEYPDWVKQKGTAKDVVNSDLPWDV